MLKRVYSFLKLDQVSASGVIIWVSLALATWLINELLVYFKSISTGFFTTFLGWLLYPLPIQLNVLTAIFLIFAVVFASNRIGKSLSQVGRKGTIIFLEDFETRSPHRWIAPFWGGPLQALSWLGDGLGISARPGVWQNNIQHNENGAYIDIKHNIYEGFVYEVRCRVKSEINTTMGFRLCVHDTLDKNEIRFPAHGFRTPGLDLEDFSVRFKATSSNALRIQLHCRAGEGSILIKQVTVTNL